MRKCIKCEKNRSAKEFYYKSGNICISCSNEISLKYYHNNRKRISDQHKLYHKINKDKIDRYNKEYSTKQKDKVFEFYGVKCICCGESNILFLTLDHTRNDGNECRKRVHSKGGTALYTWIVNNNFPNIFQTMCYNCNMGKSRNNGICPHNKNG